MLPLMSIVPICIGLLTLFGAWADHTMLCKRISATNVEQFRSGSKPVVISRCTAPRPLQ